MRLLFVLSIGLALSAAACIGGGTLGSGVPLVESLDLDLGNVRNIEIADAWDAEIREGDIASIKITIDDNLRGMVRISVDDSTVTVGLEGSTRPIVGFHLVITLPEIDSIQVRDASQAVADDVSVAQLHVQDASSLVVINNRAAALDISASDASQIEVSGVADSLAVRVSDASRADFRGLAVEVADVEVRDASNLKVNASERATGSAHDASAITVFGEATISITTSDVSSVSRG